jgi:hypothetical protein
MLQKLRRAMVRTEREPLKDNVEVDETYIGGREAGLCGGATYLTRRSLWARQRSGAKLPEGYASKWFPTSRPGL